MIRLVAIAVVLAACSKSSSTDCEALKVKYLAQAERNVDEAVGGMEPGPNKDELLAQGKKEIGMAQDRFVGACKDLGDKMDATCFEAGGDVKERKKRCHDLQKELDHRLYRP
jgi:hypothetical protein